MTKRERQIDKIRGRRRKLTSRKKIAMKHGNAELQKKRKEKDQNGLSKHSGNAMENRPHLTTTFNSG
jgi:hypothetical protein